MLLGLAPSAVAQAPPPVPALPDTQRLTAYSITATTCACAVGFALYGDGTDVDNWIQVYIGGTRYLSTDVNHGWSLSSATGTLATIPRPITNAVLTFNAVQTGTVQIVGERRPRRTTQFNENTGVTARDLNQAITDIVAQNRERWDQFFNLTGTALPIRSGNTGTFATVSGALTNGNCVTADSNGNLISGSGACVSAGSGVSPATGGQFAVYQSSGSTVVGQGASWFDTVFCNTVGYIIVRTTGAWTCSRTVPLNVVWFGADPTGVADSTSAIQTVFNLVGSVDPRNTPPGYSVYFPCGNYSISSVSLTSTTGSPYTSAMGHIYGDGNCTIIKQNSSSLSLDMIKLGGGGLYGTSNLIFERMALDANGVKTAGAGILVTGACNDTIRDIWSSTGNLWNGIVFNGICNNYVTSDFIVSARNDGMQIYNAYNCSTPATVSGGGSIGTITPVTHVLSANTGGGGTVLSMTSTSGIAVGMNAQDVSIGPNALIGATVQSIVTNVSVTLTSGVTVQWNNGDTVLFGGDCGSTSLVVDGNTQFNNGVRNGISILGGVGAIYIQQAQLQSNGQHGVYADTSLSHGLSNREFFFGWLAQEDGSGLEGIYFTAASGTTVGSSFSNFFCATCFMGNTGQHYGLFVGQQHSQLSPALSGSIVVITGCECYAGISTQDNGSLIITGSRFGPTFSSINGLNYNPLAPVASTSGSAGTTLDVIGNTFIGSGTISGLTGVAINFANNAASQHITGNNFLGLSNNGDVTGFVAGTNSWCYNNVNSQTCGAKVPLSVTFANLPAVPQNGAWAYVSDGLAANCADTTCTTWGTNVTGGGGALKLLVWYNGAHWTLAGK
jgi:hypothetical protein